MRWSDIADEGLGHLGDAGAAAEQRDDTNIRVDGSNNSNAIAPPRPIGPATTAARILSCLDSISPSRPGLSLHELHHEQQGGREEGRHDNSETVSRGGKTKRFRVFELPSLPIGGQPPKDRGRAQQQPGPRTRPE